MEKGFDKPLASFDSEKDACGYANDLAKTRLVSKVVIEGRKLVGRLSLPAQAKRRLEAAQHKADLLAAASRPAIAKARETAAAADDYVHESPWTPIGIAAAAGILIGFLTAQFHSRGSSCDSEELS